MGSSDSGGVGSGLADGSVGSIVWVRRRNGSWWPGKILGSDELSATHLMSPRSGTPVKLLGREDASVDWYNLEKSKRVKPFRCGEFSECIERAEAAQGLPAKKREKYARREDAILHALELEKEFLEKKYGKIVDNTANMQNNSSDYAIKEISTSSITLRNNNIKCNNLEMHKVRRNGDSYVENECDSSPSCADWAKQGAWPNSKLESLEMKPQRTVPPQYGVRTAPSKGLMVSSTSLNGSYSSKAQAVIDDHDYTICTARACPQRFADTNFSNIMDEKDLILERVTEGSSLKGHKKCGPLLQELRSEKLAGHTWQPDDDIVSITGRKVLQRVKRSRTVHFPTGSGSFMNSGDGSNTDLELPISQLGVVNGHPHSSAFVDETSAGSSEDTETDSSDTNFMIPVMDAEMAACSDVFTPRRHSSALNRLDIMAGHEGTSTESSDKLSPDHSQFHLCDSISASTGVSRWQIKGKRNVRNLTRMSRDSPASEVFFHADRSSSPSLRYYHNCDGYINEVDFIDDDCRPHTERIGEVLSKMKATSGQNLIDWEEFTLGDRSMRGFLGERTGHSGHGMLIDVHLQVQAKHRGEHAPWVSLMSKLNGKAITGHPIQVEKLDDGSTDVLLATCGACGDLGYDNEGNRVPPAWRTARRTSNSRVPPPRLPPRLDGYAADRYSHAKKLVPGSSGAKKGLAKKSISYVDRHRPQRSKKPLKKGSPSASQKTRTLSSMGINRRLGYRSRHYCGSYDMDGVIKPLTSGPTTVSCIPVKLVFSRLLEVIGRPSAYSVSQQ